MLTNHQKFIASFVALTSSTLVQNLSTTQAAKDSSKQMKDSLLSTLLLLKPLLNEKNSSFEQHSAPKEVR